MLGLYYIIFYTVGKTIKSTFQRFIPCPNQISVPQVTTETLHVGRNCPAAELTHSWRVSVYLKQFS